ncbi:30S ribosomal protein S13 [Streptomyces thinghirensis]|nr:30S ribosomal protein S13 [Streptomyces thinghirensis]
MARVSGVDIPREKRVEIALTSVRHRRTLFAADAGCHRGGPDTRVRDLTEEQLVAIRQYVDNSIIKTEGDLRREVQADIRRKVEIGTYQGLPPPSRSAVRGQRTSTNARTRKGPRRAIAGKKKPGKK